MFNRPKIIYDLYPIFVIEIGVISAMRKLKIHVADVASAAVCDLVARGAYSDATSHGPGIQPMPKPKR
jgi:hypothetical protein